MDQPSVDYTQLNPQIIFSWTAPLRPYKKRGKNVLRFYLALALLLSLIVFFFGDRILIMPIWAVLFLFYTLTITPPPDVDSKITKFGVETAGITMRWEMLSHFYFTRRFDFDILTIVGHEPFYLHSYLTIPSLEIKNKVMAILSEHILYQNKPERNFSDKLIDLFSYLLPDDNEEENKVTPLTTFSQKPVETSL